MGQHLKVSRGLTHLRSHGETLGIDHHGCEGYGALPAGVHRLYCSADVFQLGIDRRKRTIQAMQPPDILEAYAKRDQRIKVVHSKRNLLIPALKEGYAEATGELINRMDSDDRMPQDKIEVSGA